MKTYFDLLDMRSYKTSGFSGTRYAFYKGKPVLVEKEEDIRKFRGHTDIFFECDENGDKLVVKAPEVTAKKYVKYNANLAKLVEEMENTQKETKEVPVKKSKREKTEIDKLLKEAESDLKASKRPKAASKIKKNELECEHCEQVFKTKKELDKHLDDHKDED